MKSLFFAVLLFGAVAQADAWSDLQTLFQPDVAAIQADLDRAGEMKALNVSRGERLSRTECLEILKKIKSNYDVDPFEIVMDYGPISAVGCGEDEARSESFFQKRELTGQFGAAIAMVLQTSSPGLSNDYKNLTSYFLDANYKVVEESQMRYFNGSSAASTARVSAFDPKGVMMSHYYYLSYVHKNWIDRSSVSTPDGRIPSAIQYTMKSSGNPQRVTLVKQYYVAEATNKPWDRFHLLLPLASMGGIYSFGSKNKFYPYSFRHYSRRSVGGNTLCSYGFFQKEDQPAAPWLPSEGASSKCLITW